MKKLYLSKKKMIRRHYIYSRKIGFCSINKENCYVKT